MTKKKLSIYIRLKTSDIPLEKTLIEFGIFQPYSQSVIGNYQTPINSFHSNCLKRKKNQKKKY